jgi:hypothetical protein
MPAYLAPYLRPQDVVDLINEDFESRGLHQRASAHVGIHSGPDFIPNPDYRPDLPRGLDRAEQAAWISAEARDFFIRRGTATDDDTSLSDPRDRFHGRVDAMADLARWLTTAGPAPQATVITGSAGVGKSSILGRLITRANPDTRDLIPDTGVTVAGDIPAGTFDLVIHAANSSRQQTTHDLFRVLNLPQGRTMDELVGALDARARHLTLVVDALDEAQEGAEIADYLVELISRTRKLRLLIGTRPHLTRPFRRIRVTGQARVIDLDHPRWTTYTDLTAYAENLLLHPHGPRSNTGHTAGDAHRMAGAVARRAYPNYLITRLTARVLAEQGTIANDIREDELPSGDAQDAAATAFRWALTTRLTSRYPRIRDLLRPLAYIEGAGLPAHRLWPALATTFAGSPVTEADLAAVTAATPPAPTSWKPSTPTADPSSGSTTKPSPTNYAATPHGMPCSASHALSSTAYRAPHCPFSERTPSTATPVFSRMILSRFATQCAISAAAGGSCALSAASVKPSGVGGCFVVGEERHRSGVGEGNEHSALEQRGEYRLRCGFVPVRTAVEKVGETHVRIDYACGVVPGPLPPARPHRHPTTGARGPAGARTARSPARRRPAVFPVGCCRGQ